MRRWSERLMNVVSIQYELPLSSYYYFFTDGLETCESVNANCLKSAPLLSIYIDDVDCWWWCWVWGKKLRHIQTIISMMCNKEN